MKKLSILFLGLIATSANAIDVVELQLPKSAKVVVQLQFRNGSICDPPGKEGLTYLTSQLITQGGTATMTRDEIQDKIYPWSAVYYSSCDKEVSNFIFAVPKDFVDPFYEIIKGLILSPSF